jgi:hypothetical protein
MLSPPNARARRRRCARYRVPRKRSRGGVDGTTIGIFGSIDHLYDGVRVSPTREKCSRSSANYAHTESERRSNSRSGAKTILSSTGLLCRENPLRLA